MNSIEAVVVMSLMYVRLRLSSPGKDFSMTSRMSSSLFSDLINLSQSVARKVKCISICDLDWFDMDLDIQFHNL